MVKGALFARYSRSPKSLRRLFLEEFVGDLDLTGDLTVDATIGLRRAEELYDRVVVPINMTHPDGAKPKGRKAPAKRAKKTS